MVPVNHLSIAPALRHFLPFPLLTVPIKEGQFGEGEREKKSSNPRTTPCPQNRIDRRLGSPSSTNLSNSLLGGTTQDCAPRMDVRHSGEPPRRPEVRRSRLWLHL
ncbi:hypothetical protein HOY82DRAFT_588115 [Tuber indicum]|nr:hypothetical protein HOY82DRAFT_588115 [Tuber indicum]